MDKLFGALTALVFVVSATAVVADPERDVFAERDVEVAMAAPLATAAELVEPAPPPGPPRVLDVLIDISEQLATVVVNGAERYSWPVSTGRKAHWTPTGVFKPQFLSKRHRSSRYNNAPMPFSVFFNGNIAIHGTTAISKLGQMASHGCVRLHPDNAEILFGLVETVGFNDVVVRVQH